METPGITSRETNYSGRFLLYETVRYRDARGVGRVWEAVKRQKDQGAVIILSSFQPSGRVALIRQFRPPLGAFSLEVPAGLIDDGETAEEAAVREFKEETGYTGTVTWCGPASSSSAGLTGETVSLVCMSVDENAVENQHPRQQLEETEAIQVMLVQKTELAHVIRKALAEGDVPDSRLIAWCLGMSLFV